MSRFQQGDRVVVNGFFFMSKEHGTVKDITEMQIRNVEVSLDDGETKWYAEDDLSPEELTQEEVRAEIKNVTNRVEKVSSQLPGEMRTELPNHLRFIEDAQVSNDKEKAGRECKYVADNLEDVSRDGFVTFLLVGKHKNKP
ncbi:hypothetical protein PI95_025175 [Hassallia byssoidea VB512170]|uniref:Uncharacterized protein n=1 Tax=Hassallia byssoidea VB512170 TaxID=1304833 RepID=A0A846HDW6_9CYAN|nr:hypothetical protein [Hassalia byssoidea]NEU75757.1 hypothetical protein [Hassalia byssoidea VB512170]